MRGEILLDPVDIYAEIHKLILHYSQDRTTVHTYRTGFLNGMKEAMFAVQRLADVERAKTARSEVENGDNR
jgi:hypothetical protein